MNAPGYALRSDARLLHPHQILGCVLGGRIGVRYHAIRACQTGRRIGHAARARCWTEEGIEIAPDTLFERLHDEPLLLYHLEWLAKQQQIREAPAEGLLFVTLDADSFELGNREDGSNVFLDLFAGSGLGERLVVDVVENLQVRDLMFSRRMIDQLMGSGIKLAMRDLAVSGGLVTCGTFADAAYLRYELAWLRTGDRLRRERVLRWSLEAARGLNVLTLLDGVHDAEDLAFARAQGFDLVQGDVDVP